MRFSATDQEDLVSERRDACLRTSGYNLTFYAEKKHQKPITSRTYRDVIVIILAPEPLHAVHQRPGRMIVAFPDLGFGAGFPRGFFVEAAPVPPAVLGVDEIDFCIGPEPLEFVEIALFVVGEEVGHEEEGVERLGLRPPDFGVVNKGGPSCLGGCWGAVVS